MRGAIGPSSHLRQETPEAQGIKVRIAALDDLIEEQEHFLALLRMRRQRLSKDLVIAVRTGR